MSSGKPETPHKAGEKSTDPPKMVKRLVEMKGTEGTLLLLGTVKGLLSEASLVREEIGRRSPNVVALTCNAEEARSLKTLGKKRPEGFDLRKVGEVQELAQLIWSWNCKCGHSNPPEAESCRKCSLPAPGEGASKVSGRVDDSPKKAHAAADNIWAETGSPGGRKRPADAPEFEIGDVISQHDETYLELLQAFGEVRFPSPAFLAAVGVAQSDGMKLFGVDMGENEFTDLHCQQVGYFDLLRSSRVVQKIEKKGMRASTAEEYVLEWDRQEMRIGGYARVEDARVRHMARRLAKLAKKGERTLCVCELERLESLTKVLSEHGFRPSGGK